MYLYKCSNKGAAIGAANAVSCMKWGIDSNICFKCKEIKFNMKDCQCCWTSSDSTKYLKSAVDVCWSSVNFNLCFSKKENLKDLTQTIQPKISSPKYLRQQFTLWLLSWNCPTWFTAHTGSFRDALSDVSWTFFELVPLLDDWLTPFT